MAALQSYNTTYAQFADRQQASGCAEVLRSEQSQRPKMRMVVSSTRKGHAELPLALTHTRGGMVRGALAGGGLCLGLALLGALLQSGKGHPVNWVVVALLGGLAALMGAFAGGLVGSMNPRPKIDAMEKEGDVVLAVYSSDRSDLAWAARLFQTWGAQPRYRLTPARAVEDWPVGGAPATGTA
ncbi:MAG: hypothetical protein HOW73_29655 [Polyangiaceae bacterium]|nr:hypothetical protein [Polyangiaceae bacterium]